LTDVHCICNFLFEEMLHHVASIQSDANALPKFIHQIQKTIP